MDDPLQTKPAVHPLVLVVDDDEDTRLNLSDILALEGYRVEVAGSARRIAFSLSVGRGVASSSGSQAGTPQEIVPLLRQKAPDAAVIIVTGYADIEGAISALRSGAADYILKPVNPDAPLASVRRVLQRQQDAQEIARLNRVLASSEEQYRSLFEKALDGLIILDDNERMIAVNRAACSEFSSTPAAMRGSELDSLHVCINGAIRPARWTDFFGERNNSGEYRLVRGDGAAIDVEYRAVSSFASGRHLLSLRDVTDRKRAEERARQASRLAAIGETMADLVHESRNALQRSKASLEMLSLEIEDRPEALKLVARVERAQEDLHHLYEEVRQ